VKDVSEAKRKLEKVKKPHLQHKKLFPHLFATAMLSHALCLRMKLTQKVVAVHVQGTKSAIPTEFILEVEESSHAR
jgi:hypothetical protein